VAASLGVELNFGAGYDAKGLSQFLSALDYSNAQALQTTMEQNVSLLKKGMYFDDHNSNPAAGDGNPDDAPELSFFADFEIGPGDGLRHGRIPGHRQLRSERSARPAAGWPRLQPQPVHLRRQGPPRRTAAGDQLQPQDAVQHQRRPDRRRQPRVRGQNRHPA